MTIQSLALLAAGITVASAQINYIDATSGASGNTKIWDGSAYSLFTPAGSGVSSGSDGFWRERTALGNGATVFESAGQTGGTANNSENVARLATTISGLTPGSSYNVFTYFWDVVNTPNQWRVQSSLIDPGVGTDMSLFSETNSATLASLSTFAVTPLLTEADRTLFQASLGVGIADGSGQIVVYVDDDPVLRQSPNQVTSSLRTWYDGVGYSVVPEPTTGALLCLGIAALIGFRRHRQ